MSDQQMMMAQQNPELAQHVLQQNPELAQQVMPGAMAAASSGMNAPNVSPGQDLMSGMKARMMNMGQDPKMWQNLGGIGAMIRQSRPQGALASPMMDAGRGMQQQQGLGRPQMGALYQARPSRIY